MIPGSMAGAAGHAGSQLWKSWSCCFGRCCVCDCRTSIASQADQFKTGTDVAETPLWRVRLLHDLRCLVQHAKGGASRVGRICCPMRHHPSAWATAHAVHTSHGVSGKPVAAMEATHGSHPWEPPVEAAVTCGWGGRQRTPFAPQQSPPARSAARTHCHGDQTSHARRCGPRHRSAACRAPTPFDSWATLVVARRRCAQAAVPPRRSSRGVPPGRAG
mmetsp:Transcript_15802/g.47587  ORF Transcript_15802/g.47587 Transcript_15802/m.47587 type:complete len:217 (-) Transcript_15802:1161-1811(-)